MLSFCAMDEDGAADGPDRRIGEQIASSKLLARGRAGRPTRRRLSKLSESAPIMGPSISLDA